MPTPPSLETLNTLTNDVHQFTLPNGLTVLTKEVHTAPVVNVQIWYRVGSRNETPGCSGLSHQLEHLLFKGTHTRPIQFGQLFNALGSDSNAFTSYDMTAYFGTVGREQLASLLVLEADRMANTYIDAEQLASEQRVVISELQGYENSPEYRLGRLLMRQAFPHRAYGLPVGGTKVDVEQFTVEQVQNYYRQYYHPGNAVLVVVGDFETAPTQALIEDVFGPLAAQSQSQHWPHHALDAQGAGQAEPLILSEPGSAALLEVVYPLPNLLHPDVPALDIMDMVLSAGRSSRFYASLIESGLASTASAYAVTLLEPGWYNIAITAAPDQDLDKIEHVLAQTITDLQATPINPAELQRAKVQLKAGLILSNRDIDHQASQLAYNQLVAGDYRYSDRFLAQLDQVTIADVQRVTQQYLRPEQKTVGRFEPTTLAGASQVGGGPITQTAEDFSAGEPIDPALVAQYLPQQPTVLVSHTQTLPDCIHLANGLRVLLLEDHSAPTLTLGGYLAAGNGFDLLHQPGVAALTADNVMSGTRTHDALAIAQALEDRGASLDFASFREGVDVEGYALAADIPVLLATLAEVLQDATFPVQEVEISRQRALSSLHLELDDPGRLARRTFQQHLYPSDHPFYPFPSLETVQAITPEALQRFYRNFYLPQATVLALVGDFELDQVRSQLQQTLGQWQSTASPSDLHCPEVSLPPEPHRIHVPLVGKPQVITYMGHVGIARHDPRYYASLILNQVLGGDTLASRLGVEIRDRKGLTYGIYSYFAAGQQAGPFAIQMQTAPEDTQRAIESTLRLVQQFRQSGITAAELETAKRSILNSYPVELAAPDILTQRLLMNEVHGLPLSEIRAFPEAIHRIDLNEVNEAIESLIFPDRFVIVTAGSLEA